MILKKFNRDLINFSDSISIFYFKNNNIIIFRCLEVTKFLFLPNKLNILIFKNKIIIFNVFIFKVSNNLQKKLALQKQIMLRALKKILIGFQAKIYAKLKLTGIGYKIFETEYKTIIQFKLGHSHSIFLKLNLNFFNLKFTKLFVASKFYNELIQVCSKIKLLKWSEPYNGKGVSYAHENN